MITATMPVGGDEGRMLSFIYLIQEFPETVAVVHLYRMAKFVKQDVIDQMPGKQHERKGEIDTFTRTATSPAGFAVHDPYARESQFIPVCQRLQTVRQQTFCLMPQCLLQKTFQYELNLVRFKPGFQRTGDMQDAIR